MARLSLDNSLKFKKLVRRIALARPFVRGLLETFWDSAHARGSAIVGSEEDVEIASEWPGEPGAWFAALRDGGWVEPVRELWKIHDYWQHAPDYVVRREADKRGISRAQFTLMSSHPDFDSGVPPEVPRKTHGCLDERSEATTSEPSPAEPSEAKSAASQRKRSRAAVAAGLCENPPDGFDEFWSRYQRKTAKVKAIEAWIALNPSAEIQATIIAALDRIPRLPPHEIQFVPHPATWLNARRWEDEFVPSINNRGEPSKRYRGS